MQDKLQVRILVPQTNSVNGIPEKSSIKINISGLKDNVIRAKSLIKELIQYYHTDITHPGVIHEEVDIGK